MTLLERTLRALSRNRTEGDRCQWYMCRRIVPTHKGTRGPGYVFCDDTCAESELDGRVM